MIGWRRLAWLWLGWSAAIVPAAIAETESFDLAQLLSAQPALRGEFIQQQEIPGLREPVRSSGTFIVLSGRGLIWTTRVPVEQEIVLSERITSGADARIYRLVLQMLNGEILNDDRFATEMSGDLAGWRLQAVPVRKRIGRFVRGITVAGDALVRRVDLQLPQHVLSIEFHGVEPLQVLDEATCARLGFAADCLVEGAVSGG